MSTPEGRDQVPENLTPEGRAIVRRLDEVVETLRQFGVKQSEGEERLANRDAMIAEVRELTARQSELIAESRAQLQQGEERLANQEVMLAELKELNAEARSRLQHGEERLTNHDELIAESRAQLQQGEERLANQEVMLAELKELNAEARSRLQHGEERLTNHDELIAASRAQLQQGAERLANQEVMLAELKELNAEARSRLQHGEERLANHDELIAESRARLQEGAERLAKSELHLGYLRGAHASNAARRDADLIADDMGYQLVNQLPRGMLISFANMARASGKHENDVRSFREADLIMLVRDADGQPAYVAVEASFTVAARDIERAKRNAEYLHEFTGLKAVAAVAGVEITRGQRRNASAAGVHCYTIPARDLEAD